MLRASAPAGIGGMAGSHRAGRLHFWLGPALIGLGMACLLTVLIMEAQARAQAAPPHVALPKVESLTGVRVPEAPGLMDYVKDRNAAIALGKAFFWDMQVGGDGKTACATCHFSAGADGRLKNTLNPGTNAGDTNFFKGGPNFQLTPALFPFPKNDNDIVGSQGVTDRVFQLPGGKDSKGADICKDLADPVFFVHSGNTNIDTRRVTGRNAPSVINAVYNFRNFWDGRAQDDFNGVNPFGLRDPNAADPNTSGLYKDVNGKLQGIAVHLTLSSLASQAVGPPNNPVEMSCDGRIFPDLGRKLLSLKPLGRQKVSKQDSVLGPLVKPDDDAGLQTSYEAMIKKAFRPELWQNTTDLKKLGPDSPVVKRQLTDLNERVDDDKKVRKETADDERKRKVIVPNNQYREMELNFSLFWGLAIQMYESTLVADQTPVDRFLSGADASALSADQLAGRDLYEGKAKCAACHGGAATTNANVFNVINERLERMHMGDNGIAVYDNGFYNTGVRQTNEDLGVGGTDPFKNPLSEVGFCQAFIQNHAGQSCPIKNLDQNGNVQDSSISDSIKPRPDENIPTSALQPNERINAAGSFKTPHLRNVELTGPYMHNGGLLTLRQVVDFYNRGGDFHDENIANLDPNIEPLGLTDKEEDQLVQFLLGLTDERVRFEAAPFDHPSLCVPQGFKTNPDGSLKLSDSRPQDDMTCIPAVGAGGRSFETRLQPYLKVDPRQP